jgi:chromosome segregation ATPase
MSASAQLGLFDIELQKEVQDLKAALEWERTQRLRTEARLDDAKQHYRRLRHKCADLTAELQGKNGWIQSLQGRVALLELAMQSKKALAPEDPAIAPDALDRALKLLAAQVHPDRWQGSPIAEELTKEVLALRDRVREGRL